MWRVFDELLPALGIGLPLAACLVWILTRARVGCGQANSTARVTSALDVALILVAALVAYLTLTPKPGPTTVNVVPFQDILDSVDASTVVIQVGGNLVLLAAAGALLPFRFAKIRRVPWLLAAAVVASLSIESAQYSLRLGRVASIDDVIINVIGFMLGAGTVAGFVRIVGQRSSRTETTRSTG